jgi:hypothetical protein
LASFPSDILVSNEKARFVDALGLISNNDFDIAKEGMKIVKKHVFLINKRTLAALNRKFK